MAGQFIFIRDRDFEVGVNVAHISKWQYTPPGERQSATLDLYVDGERQYTLKDAEANRVKNFLETLLISL